MNRLVEPFEKHDLTPAPFFRENQQGLRERLLLQSRDHPSRARHGFLGSQRLLLRVYRWLSRSRLVINA